MDSRTEIIRVIKNQVSLTDGEAEYFAEQFKEVRLKKGQYIVQPGFTARHRTYVVKGALRSFVLDQKGNEHTISFAIEDWWISDVNSYIFQRPATMHVVALENSLVLQLDYERELQLKKLSWKYETFFRQSAERGFAFLQRSLIANLTHSAEERYDLFLERYPLVADRLPQYVLASYLGMTTQFLSRIRKRKSRPS